MATNDICPLCDKKLLKSEGPFNVSLYVMECGICGTFEIYDPDGVKDRLSAKGFPCYGKGHLLSGFIRERTYRKKISRLKPPFDITVIKTENIEDILNSPEIPKSHEVFKKLDKLLLYCYSYEGKDGRRGPGTIIKFDENKDYPIFYGEGPAEHSSFFSRLNPPVYGYLESPQGISDYVISYRGWQRLNEILTELPKTTNVL